jgi:DNA invertase Pin-like site-specific DNA recombinase
MSNITNDQGGDDNICGDIERESELRQQREQIFQSWIEGNPLSRIANETGLPIGVVYRRLKEMQKERIVEQGG